MTVTFEQHQNWLLQLLRHFSQLLLQLDDGLGLSEGAAGFPLTSCLRELEWIVAHVRLGCEARGLRGDVDALRGQVALTLLASHVQYQPLVSAYVELLSHGSTAANPSLQLQLVDGALFCVRQWLDLALLQSPAHEDDARRLVPLVLVSRGGESTLVGWLRLLRGKVQELRGLPLPDAWLRQAELEAGRITVLLQQFCVTLER